MMCVYSTWHTLRLFEYLLLVLSQRILCAGQEDWSLNELDLGVSVYYMVSIRTPSYVGELGDNHFCSGVIITSTWVLTAAHCVTMTAHSKDYRKIRHEDIVVVTNTKQRRELPEERNVMEVSEIWVHDNYKRHCDHDLAMLKLERIIPGKWVFHKRLKLPKLPLEMNASCLFLSWLQGSDANELTQQPVEATVYNPCETLFASCSKCDNLCIKNVANDAFNQDDAGSPLFCSRMLYGLAAGINCGRSVTSHRLYINIYGYISWIKNVMANCVQSSLVLPPSLLLLFLPLVINC